MLPNTQNIIFIETGDNSLRLNNIICVFIKLNVNHTLLNYYYVINYIVFRQSINFLL